MMGSSTRTTALFTAARDSRSSTTAPKPASNAARPSTRAIATITGRIASTLRPTAASIRQLRAHRERARANAGTAARLAGEHRDEGRPRGVLSRAAAGQDGADRAGAAQQGGDAGRFRLRVQPGQWKSAFGGAVVDVAVGGSIATTVAPHDVAVFVLDAPVYRRDAEDRTGPRHVTRAAPRGELIRIPTHPSAAATRVSWPFSATARACACRWRTTRAASAGCASRSLRRSH